MALSKKAKIGLGIVGGLLLTTCISCGLLTRAISGFAEENRKAIETARAQCGSPSEYRLRAGGNPTLPVDWQCLTSQEIAAQAEAVRLTAEQARRQQAAEAERARQQQAAQTAAQRASAEAQLPVADPANPSFTAGSLPAVAPVPVPVAVGPTPEVSFALRALAGAGPDAATIIGAARILKGALERTASPPGGLSELHAGLNAVLEGLPAPPRDAPAEPPPLVEPPYTGAIHMRGTYRGPYDGGMFGADGVVIQMGGQYCIVLGAAAASVFTARMDGYGTPTGDTKTLNIGRTGREAAVYRFADRETYDDDQRTHRESLAAAQAAYRVKVNTFREADRAHRESARSWERGLQQRRAAIAALPGAAAAAVAGLAIQ